MTDTEPKSEEMWDIIARRELTIKESKITKEIENEKSAQNPFEFEIDALERAANSIYIEAVQKLNTEKMWLIYINFCFERFESTLKSIHPILPVAFLSIFLFYMLCKCLKNNLTA